MGNRWRWRLRRAGAGRLACTLVMGCLLAPATLESKDHPPFAARAGLELADDAARAWADDAQLVYVENDEDVTPAGLSPRWGYLYTSATKDRSRGYSVRDGKIVDAADLEFQLEAPPVEADWIDSARALQVAEAKGGDSYRTDHQGGLRAMLLIRGAFHHKNPDRTTWTLVYDSPTEPSLFVVVDASSGDVVRMWKG